MATLLQNVPRVALKVQWVLLENRWIWFWQWLITWFVVCIVAFQKWNIRLVSLKGTLDLTDSDNKSTCDLKTHLLKGPCHFSLPIQDFELFYWIVQGLYLSASQVQCCTRWATKQVCYVRKATHMWHNCQNVLVCSMSCETLVFEMEWKLLVSYWWIVWIGNFFKCVKMKVDTHFSMSICWYKYTGILLNRINNMFF